MERKRVTLTISVNVDLDPVPGAFHTKESAHEIVAHILEDTLNTRIPHYNPSVHMSE